MLLVIGCTSNTARDEVTTTAQGTPSTTRLNPRDTRAADAALDRVIRFSARSLRDTDPFTLVLLDYLSRRFSIADLSSAHGLAQQAMANADPKLEPELRLFQPTARPTAESLRDSSADLNSLLVRNALACDAPGVAPNFEATLIEAIRRGGYYLTHAAIAIGIQSELGCVATGGDAVRIEIIGALEQVVRRQSQVDDLAVERVAMLCYLGASARVPPARITSIVAAIASTGEPPGPDAATRRHTAALTIWALSIVLARPETAATIVAAL